MNPQVNPQICRITIVNSPRKNLALEKSKIRAIFTIVIQIFTIVIHPFFKIGIFYNTPYNNREFVYNCDTILRKFQRKVFERATFIFVKLLL